MFKKGKGLLVLSFLIIFTIIIIVNAQELPIAHEFRFPLDGDWSPLWQDFNKWNSTWNGYHLGEDVGREDADKKNYAVYPMADGIVKFANIVLGYTVIIEHELSDNDPDGNYVCSVYYHMKRPGEGGIKLTLGEIVSMDSPIGYVSGKWKDHKSFPHLHFGIRKGRYKPETDKDPRTGFWYYPGYTVIKKDGEVQKNLDDPTHKQILADWFNPSTDPKNGTGFIERHVTQIEQTTEISKTTPIITSPLKITLDPPYCVGDTINAEFSITNKDATSITFSVLTIGGRDPDNQVADFTHRQNITLEPSKSYNYQGTLTLNKVGDYHFFCTYQTPDGDWNTSIDLGPGLDDVDRIENIIVESREKSSQGLVRIGDFSIDLTKVERSKDTAMLSFAITKIDDTHSAPGFLEFTLIDDHENEYTTDYTIDLEGAWIILNTLPKGFTYVDSINVSIPRIAPIDRIRLKGYYTSNEISFKEIHFCQPKLMQDFGSYNIKPGATFNLGKYLKFTIAGPKAGVTGWTLAVTVKNTEYNPIGAGIRIGTQFADGQVRWGCANSAEVPGLGQKTFRFHIVLSPLEDVACWSQPTMLIIRYWGGPTEALKVMPLTYADFTPLPERIAYNDGYYIYVMNTDGTERSMFCKGNNPSWSPDGSKIIFNEGTKLRVSTADGSAKSQLCVTGNAALSPDDKKIAYFHRNYIYTMNVDCSGKTKLCGGIYPIWSPDGKKIAFQSGRCVEDEKGYINCFFFIHTINADGSSLACLHKGICPSWSPDGSQIAFSYGAYVWHRHNVSFETYICVMNDDGSGVTKLATLKTGKLAGHPAWSPDMTKLAFSCANQIYVMNADGSDIIILARGKHPSWAPATKFVTGDSLK